MNRADFFQHLIDDYLFLDLRNMAGLQQKEGERGGGVGYPILATCTSGMELLGGLLQGKDYTRAEDWKYFEHYWQEYLVKVNGRYAPFAELFWKLVRHGVAHTYMARAAITVTKGNKEFHLVFYDEGSKFNIDCLEFYRDFLASYQGEVKPRLTKEDDFTIQVQKNIDLMLKESSELCRQIFSKVQASLASTTSATPNPVPSGTKPPATTTTLIPDDIRQKLKPPDFQSSASRVSGATLAAPEALDALKKRTEEEKNDEPPPTLSAVL